MVVILGERFGSIVILLLVWFGPFHYAKAQWIQDNRCTRRRDLRTSSITTELEKNEVQLLEIEGRRQQHLDKEERDEAPNATTHDKQDQYWYSRLRGYKQSATSSKNWNKNAATKQSGRNLFDEDPSSFMVMMHWQIGNCWQGEWIERRWCMTCELGDDCIAGNKLWTEFCDNSPGQKFTWIPQLDTPISRTNDDDDSVGMNQNYGQLKLAYFDLCLERMTTNTYQLQPCDANSPYQIMVGWHPTQPFELHPIDNRQEKCINQHHHPRPQEEIANTSCEMAAQFHTNLWSVYQNDNAGNEMVRLRRPQCSEEQPCGLCEGDCDTSLDCEGDLVCVQRGVDDAQMPVPGCSGFPNLNADYCASPEDLFAPPIPNHSLRLRDPSCTADNPCLNQCEGDCDGDDSCFGSMKCFLRGEENRDENVPNCAGEGIPEADYCYEPDEVTSLLAQKRLQEQPMGCTESKPCLQCQGDCDNDSQCYGPLECFQRRDDEPLKPVPGCLGDGVSGADYCYLPEGASFPTSSSNTNPVDNNDVGGATIPVQPNLDPLPSRPSSTLDSPKPLDDDIKRCSENVPCGECSGDCDGDAGCAGSLVCFQRPFNQPFKEVPGCVGRGVLGADYCVKP